jgi:hypothetical protein
MPYNNNRYERTPYDKLMNVINDPTIETYEKSFYINNLSDHVYNSNMNTVKNYGSGLAQGRISFVNLGDTVTIDIYSKPVTRMILHGARFNKNNSFGPADIHEGSDYVIFTPYPPPIPKNMSKEYHMRVVPGKSYHVTLNYNKSTDKYVYYSKALN